MSKKLSPAFTELVLDSLLKVIWHRKPFARFLVQHGIKESILNQWHAEQTKRAFLDWLWPHLTKSEKGQGAILEMARTIAAMKEFPDLEGKADSRDKVVAAKAAVASIRAALREVEGKIEAENAAAERRAANQAVMADRLAEQQSLEKLQARLMELSTQVGAPAAGRDFEKWIYDLAIFYDLEARPGYNTDGRQIDGSVTIDGMTYLIEAKLTKEPTGSPDIDIFMAKIETKADNTMGVFISMSGFNDGAKKAASKNRTPMLLLDGSHLFNIILRGIASYPQVVARIREHASHTGSSYLPSTDFLR